MHNCQKRIGVCIIEHVTIYQAQNGMCHVVLVN